jgi:hypothetical protein
MQKSLNYSGNAGERSSAEVGQIGAPGLEVLMEASTKSTIFCDVLCSLVLVYRRFERIYFFRLQG